MQCIRIKVYLFLKKINRTHLGKGTHMCSIAKLHIAFSLQYKEEGRAEIHVFIYSANQCICMRVFRIIFSVELFFRSAMF